MRPLLLAVAAALAFGAVGSAAPVPVETRTGALFELRDAIKEEREAIAFLKRDPPQLERARTRIWRSQSRLYGIADYLSTTPESELELMMGGAGADDTAAATVIPWTHPDPKGIEATLFYLERALKVKLEAQPRLRTSLPPTTKTPQCSDGKDNDGDGITDWTLEPGCSSARDARERSPFRCALGSEQAAGRLAVTGSCTGTFSEVEFTFLDGLQLNGRFDVKHAPSCSPPTPTRARCKTKNGAQNPGRLIDARFTTTPQEPGQRVQLRFFDVRKRAIGRFVVAPR
jgi:hypothetical protein